MKTIDATEIEQRQWDVLNSLGSCEVSGETADFLARAYRLGEKFLVYCNGIRGECLLASVVGKKKIGKDKIFYILIKENLISS